MSREAGGSLPDVAEGRTHRGEPLRAPVSCDICGRTILDGEEIGHFQGEERVLAACPLCEAKTLAQGLVRAA
jgi:hypothetical protein